MTLVAGVELEVVLVLTVAILAAGFLAVNVCTRKPADPKRDAWLKAYPADAEPPRSRAFRTEELKHFDGRDGRKLFLGAKGKVFDIGYLYRGWEAYGHGSGYNVFAAKDASVGLATMQLDVSKWGSTMTWADLTEEQQGVLNDWVDKFENSYGYPVIGYLVDGFFPRSSLKDE